MAGKAFSVSVIIPTYNRAGSIGRALESVFAQTLSPDQVIVVDDGSTDGTQSLVSKSFPGAVYLRQENLGVSAARNLGICHSRGRWIALLDSDDVWREEKLARQASALELAPDMKVCHTDETWIRNGIRVNPMEKHTKAGGWIFRRCLPLCAMSPSSIIIERSVFDQVGLFDTSLPACEDYDLWLRITARYPVLFLAEPLIVKYGGHEDQLSRRFWGMDRFRIHALEKIIAADALRPGDRKAAIEVLLQKAEVYLGGARKRGKTAEVQHYEALCRRYRSGEILGDRS